MLLVETGFHDEPQRRIVSNVGTAKPISVQCECKVSRINRVLTPVEDSEQNQVLGKGAITKLEKIEQDVEQLTSEELAAFRQWFQAFDAALWDRQLESDVHTGKLERLRQDAVTEHQDRRTREL